MKFRRKPSFFEAEQFVGPAEVVPDEEGSPPSVKGVEWSYGGNGNYHAFVTTTHGQKVWLKGGEWIVREPDGNGYYPIKDEIFQAAGHELVKE